MPQVPQAGANVGAYSQSPLSQGPGAGNLLMAAAIQSQDPARSIPTSGDARPKFPAVKPRKRVVDPLKGK